MRQLKHGTQIAELLLFGSGTMNIYAQVDQKEKHEDRTIRDQWHVQDRTYRTNSERNTMTAQTKAVFR